ncbi:antibiotic biosynthesis monooxygenase family protein [Nocardioides daejeonensis]|uniref:antibiotic biosynthesis monooxygenase family protein n=1 Tax=Nocardioides daejeonensis TaxID=1046556 RepID=UPI000D74BF4C|nr:antibiotic biosynthesis monooxygenase family protein [Nocardioides daejeonensis]
MYVVNRFRVPADGAERFRDDLDAAHAVLAAASGYLEGRVGRNMDDPELWALHTRWANVGAYRRALSSYDAKLVVVPLLSRAVDEPSAYEEVLVGVPLAELDRVVDADGPGGGDPGAGGRRASN